MKFIIKIFPLCISLLLIFSCSKEELSVISEPLKVEDSVVSVMESASSKTKFISPEGCEFQLFGFADFPFQSNVIDGIDYPFCTPQLCVLIEDYFDNPYFTISSNTLKICETGFESMRHHQDCGDFSPIQITHVQYAGGTEIQFYFEPAFWECFQSELNYPGMNFQFEHELPWI